MLSYGLRKGLRRGLIMAILNSLFIFAISPSMDLQDIVRADVFFPMLGLTAMHVAGCMLRYRKTTLESEYLARKSREQEDINTIA